MGFLDIFKLLRIKEDCSIEQIYEAIEEFNKKEDSAIKRESIKLIEENMNLIKRVGLDEYKRRLAIRKELSSQGQKINIFDDESFKRVFGSINGNYTNFNQITHMNGTIKILDECFSDNKGSKKNNGNVNFCLVRENDKKPKRTKNLRNALIFVVAVVGAVIIFSTALIGYTNNFPDTPSTTVSQSSSEEDSTKQEELVFIDYEVISGDTKTKIVNKLELNQEQSSKIPVDIYQGDVYKLKVNKEIADSYNYEYKIIRTMVFSYELPPGGSLFDIAQYAKEEYPELFGNLTLNQIVSQISSDNGCTHYDYSYGTYNIYIHASQKQIDELVSKELLPELNKGNAY